MIQQGNIYFTTFLLLVYSKASISNLTMLDESGLQNTDKVFKIPAMIQALLLHITSLTHHKQLS